MIRRKRYAEIMRDVDTLIESAGVRDIQLKAADFDLVAEFLKHDEKRRPEGIPYNNRIIKKIQKGKMG